MVRFWRCTGKTARSPGLPKTTWLHIPRPSPWISPARVRWSIFPETPSSGFLRSTAPCSGGTPWKTSYDLNIATPIFVPPDQIFISSGYDHGAALLRIESDGDGFSATRVWESRRMKNHFGTSVLVGEYIYGFDNAILKCIEARTGKEQWKHRGYGKGGFDLRRRAPRPVE